MDFLSSDPLQLAHASQQEGLTFAKQAIQADQEGRQSDAVIFYTEAVNALGRACSLNPALSSSIMPHLQQYNSRASQLRQETSKMRSQLYRRQQSEDDRVSKSVLRNLEYQLEQACVEDERGHIDTAIALYTEAVETALGKLKSVSNKEITGKVKSRVKLGLDRLDHLKLTKKKKKTKSWEDLPGPPSFDPNKPPGRASETDEVDLDDRLKQALRLRPLAGYLDTTDDLSSRGAAANPKPVGGGGGGKKSSGGGGGAGFTEKEKKILHYTGFVNGKMFVPWLDADIEELRMVSKLPGSFKDPDGLPALAEKQKTHLDGWVRPDDICDDPKIIKVVSSMTVKQTLIGDCSFVASLAITADYERKFREHLITSIIFPQNRHGQPVVSASGKYLIKLWINGCKRKVMIDDRLPLGRDGQLLCSFSKHEDEFWISLIEKAYMKVMGGYDFPGSSSNIDLYALTGWIPERIELKDRKDSELDAVFRQIEHTHKRGNALITVATGDLSAADKERSGLVPLHAYALLDIKEIHGYKLLQLKNPWSHQRWKGNFSEGDSNWTEELQRSLNYSQTQALREDNGVFWIDWKSLYHFFDVLYVNWNPKLFEYKSTFHDVWDPPKEEYKEQYSYKLTTNPQYRLTVKSSKPGRVWALLIRHITEKDDFAHNKKFICLHVAEARGRGLKHFPGDYLVQGVKINTPHYLAKLDVSSGAHSYNVVVSQLMELHSKIYYTLKVYATVPFSLEPVRVSYTHRQKVSGKWAGPTAGGCRMHSTYLNNPKYRLVLDPVAAAMVKVQIQLETKLNEGVGIVMIAESKSLGGEGFKEHFTQTYRSHYIAEEVEVPGGAYYITPTTFNPNKEGAFVLTVSTDCVMTLNRTQ